MANIELPDLLDRIIPAVVQILTPSGQGTGFVLSEDGLIISNRHVVGYERFVKVVTKEKKEYYGQIIASNPHIDFCVIYVPDAKFNDTLSMIDSDGVRLGESIVAIGHPYGYDYTISQGIISSKGRKDVGPAFKNVEFFQLDMGINPGNSGGPVVRRGTGEVIGMVTLGLRQADNIGFAVPSNYGNTYLTKINAYDRESALNSIYCTVCGSASAGSSKYCNKCGSTIEKMTLEDFKKSLNIEAGEREKEAVEFGKEKKCPSCGTVNEETAKYCKKCGSTLG